MRRKHGDASEPGQAASQKAAGKAAEQVRPEQLTGPLTAAATKLADHPFREEIQRVLRGETALGRLLNETYRTRAGVEVEGLVGALYALPPDQRTETPKTFDLIHGFLHGRNLADLELTREDIILLLSTDVGNLIRRPICHNMFAHRLERDVHTSSEAGEQVKATLVPVFAGAAWSKFILNQDVLDHIRADPPDEPIFVDMAQALDDLRAVVAEGTSEAYERAPEVAGLGDEVEAEERRQLERGILEKKTQSTSHGFNDSAEGSFCLRSVACVGRRCRRADA